MCARAGGYARKYSKWSVLSRKEERAGARGLGKRKIKERPRGTDKSNTVGEQPIVETNVQFDPLDSFLNIVVDLTVDGVTAPLIQAGEIIELPDTNVDSDEISLACDTVGGESDSHLYFIDL